MIFNLIQGLIIIIISPLFLGILKRMKAIIRGYEGAPITQPYYSIKRLFFKGRVVSKSSSFVTTIGPTIIFAAAILSAFLVPVVYADESNLLGNIFVLIFVMAIIKFFNTLLGLDCASTFGGMGSSRELFVAMFAEPVGFLMAAFLYFETRSFNISNIALSNSLNVFHKTPHTIAALAILIWIISENTRVPVDNPETHLELTMIHEAMILDISGRDLAYIELAAAIKLVVCFTLFINTFIPFGIASSITLMVLIKAMFLYLIKMFILLLALALLETTMAKFRLFRVPELLAASFSIALAAISMLYFT